MDHKKDNKEQVHARKSSRFCAVCCGPSYVTWSNEKWMHLVFSDEKKLNPMGPMLGSAIDMVYGEKQRHFRSQYAK